MKTLLQILAKRAVEEPKKTAFTFHHEPPCTYDQLWQGIVSCGGYLLQRGLKPGDRVMIAIPNSGRFFSAFYGVQWAGGIAIPVFPGSGPERIIKLADLSDAAMIIVSKTFPTAKPDQLKQEAEKSNRPLFFLEDSSEPPSPPGQQHPEIQAGDTAFIQFTSGSSGEPKGVLLTHANLLINLEQMIAGMEITRSDVFVSWLPVYHDMGLILMTMVPFYLGIDMVLLPTGLNYLKTWLKTLEERKATFTAAPDFAYRMCLIYIRESEHYDLSRMRVFLNAAEPVRAGTISRFRERFKLGHVILPAYGLAEATVGVCSGRPGKEIKVDSRGFVSVGSPFPGVRLRITRENRPANPGEIGEIAVKSEANTPGYFQNPGATKELFDQDGYIKTGDLGYRDEEGNFFIVGRKKSIIIQGGYNISAREVEELVEEFSFVRRCAAVGIDRGGTAGEQVYIFIEVKLQKSQEDTEAQLMELTIRVVQRFDHGFGFKPGRIYLLKPGAIPMTYNGKIKYLHLKERYMSGTLRKEDLILFPAY
jgi:acyl-CoA synthetase (AMP-forming)/AMP-acid ligase II